MGVERGEGARGGKEGEVGGERGQGEGRRERWGVERGEGSDREPDGGGEREVWIERRRRGQTVGLIPNARHAPGAPIFTGQTLCFQEEIGLMSSV